MNPELDLVVERVIRAPRAVVWSAWTEPARFARWWVPAPAVCRVERLEVRPGGGLVTRMSEDGVDFVPHLDAMFVVAEELERIVFTNTVDSAWRPANPAPVAMTAEMTMADHADGTAYRIVVRHGDPASRKLHAELGFADGWGSVTAQLAGVAEGEVAG
ncbi:SRPBCC domain-containing protein [Kribbella sp. NPDC051770]|uniref:SRPBCC domain-containing protein n=1 Tax=Kribbella sp. NPDC051770 TaxID=3155413 RepID=UPI00343F84E5